MEINLEPNRGQYQIQNYFPGKLIINNQVYEHSLIITQTELINWEPQKFQNLKPEDFDEIYKLKPEIILLGTGEKQEFLPASLMQKLAAKKLSVEVMNTHAACRTFNVLVSEGRNVAAALIIF